MSALTDRQISAVRGKVFLVVRCAGHEIGRHVYAALQGRLWESEPPTLVAVLDALPFHVQMIIVEADDRVAIRVLLKKVPRRAALGAALFTEGGNQLIWLTAHLLWNDLLLICGAEDEVARAVGQERNLTRGNVGGLQLAAAPHG